MKMILSALAILGFSTLALAMPAVGDTATFTGSVVSQGQTIPFQNVIALTQFNAANHQYMQSSVVTSSDGKVLDQQSSWVNETDLLTDATVTSLLANCAAQNGVLETVTVPAGTFNTCKITDQEGAMYNVSNVPFGIVKAVQPKSQLNMSLVSFQHGH
jgi:hypothetical protein